MNILSIDTSCDETSIAITNGRKILSNEIYSQILIHKNWGGVVPSLARRAHEERIDLVLETALKKAGNMSIQNDIEYIAVTHGPGLAPALEVGIQKSLELSRKFDKKIIPVNHMEGHIYSCFAQNSKGNPPRNHKFPYLCLLVSGGHSELVIFSDHITYKKIGATVDDAAGEALDKAAKMLGLGYPGGPVIETLAIAGDSSFHRFPRPMRHLDGYDFSFSGLKTSFYYFLMKMSQDEKNAHINDLAASFQEAVFDSLIFKLEKALDSTKINSLVASGGVMANKLLRSKLQKVMRKRSGAVLFPTYKTLYGDNAAMIGVAAYYKAKKGMFVETRETFQRAPRLSL